VIDLFKATPTRANFLTAVAFSKCVRLIQAQNKRTQLYLQIKVAEDKLQSLHSQRLQRWA